MKGFLSLCYVALVVAILRCGWDEPLRYRFMTPQQVAATKAAALPPPTPTPTPWILDPRQQTGALSGEGK